MSCLVILGGVTVFQLDQAEVKSQRTKEMANHPMAFIPIEQTTHNHVNAKEYYIASL